MQNILKDRLIETNKMQNENEMLKKPKAILFDWDNTLADTWPTIHSALEQTFVEMGHTPWTLEETKERVHRSLRDSFPEIFGDRWSEAGDKYLSNFKRIHLQNLTALEGAEEVLKALADTDIYVALVSNKTGENLRLEVDYIGWNGYFEKVIGAKDADEDKPSPKPVLMALEGSGIALGPDVWFVGDSITDMECAHNCNCVPIFYGDQDLTSKRYENHQPTKHFKNHQELVEVIRKF
jgi:phosphoglycolate phosphatase